MWKEDKQTQCMQQGFYGHSNEPRLYSKHK